MTMIASRVYFPSGMILSIVSLRLLRAILAYFGRGEAVSWAGAAESKALKKRSMSIAIAKLW
jgi:hypothetical protein